MEDFKTKIRQDCWDFALDCAAYYYIYTKKLKSIGVLLRISKVLGIIIPVLLGGTLASYGQNSSIITLAITITTPIALLQLCLSTYLTVIGMDEKFAEYNSMAASYSIIEGDFKMLAKYPLDNFDEYTKKFEILLEREKGISGANIDVTDKEKRMGMRFGLREYSRHCVGCKTVPLSMKSTNCDICGNF